MQKLFKISLVFILASLLTTKAEAQFKKDLEIGFTLSPSKNQQIYALAIKKRHKLGKAKKFSVGYGLRLNAYNGRNRYYVTAPAELTSGRTGPLVFFTENIFENFDSLFVDKTAHYSLNSVIYLNYQLTKKIRLGFNIDALGVSFGPKATASIIASTKPPQSRGTVSAQPTVLNALLISDNDIGMLNSELNMNYLLNKHWNVGVGLTFLFTEFTTAEPLEYNFNNDRFRQKSLLGNISINHTF